MSVKYQDIEPKLKTGDVALFHGNSWISKGIQAVTRNPYSHVGMVVRLRDIDPNNSLGGDPDRAWFFESTLRRESLPDLLDEVQPDTKEHKVHAGVQLVLLEDAFSHYDCQKVGTFNIRQLEQFDPGPEVWTALRQLMETVDRRPFPKISVMASHWLEGTFNIRCSLNTFFCAELVARCYMAMSLLDPKKHPPNYYAPKSFAPEFKHLALPQPTHLGPVQIVALD